MSILLNLIKIYFFIWQVQSTTPINDTLLLNVTTPVTQIEQSPELKAGLIILVSTLAFILLVMIITLILPKSIQDSLFRILLRQNPDQTFNYIDVGLYKTRHSIYRKEVYSLAMQSNPTKRKDDLASTSNMSAIPALAKSIYNPKLIGPPRLRPETRSTYSVPSPQLTITLAGDECPEPRRSMLKQPSPFGHQLDVRLERRHSIAHLDHTAVGTTHPGRLSWFVLPRPCSQYELSDNHQDDSSKLSRLETRIILSHKQVCFDGLGDRN